MPLAAPSLTAPAGGAAAHGHLDFVDALRVCLIALVVAHHSLEAYATRYPAELPLPDPPIPRIWVFLWVNAAFFMGLFFLLAGYFTPAAFERKGAVAFLADRCRRIGIPLVLGTVAIVPLAGWSHLALNPAVPPIGYWTYLTQYFLHHGRQPAFWPAREFWPPFNFGHLWFLEHLLIYALLFAAMRAVVPIDRGRLAPNPPSHAAIAGYAVLLAAATFVVRIWYPQDRWIGWLGFIQMEPAHTVQYVSLFALGVFAGPRRWLQSMPTRTGLLWFGIGTTLAILAYFLVGTGTLRGFNSQAAWVCLYECVLCTGLCVGLPVVFRELALGAGRLWHRLSATVLAVYVFHMPFVLLLQWALIEAPVPKWLRLLATIVGAVVASFAFCNRVILRLPYVRRVF